MVKANVQAFAAVWAAQAIRDAIPTELDFTHAELGPKDRAAALQELERIANQLLAEAMRLEAL
ncbi:hypothetical protein [Stutzerimonas nitrititolerans]|uniref:Uncharacterized protein n=1 Tax=Stutzerimonas nitrititolerans TaxID=2482751 RepID=A0ABX9URN6_9GAMM|nr:hypothetical protein [Stutzerimonas nitrititolerans]RMH95894.1 hypothetical protein EA795_20715 [Stutzerimonas nitrititolerans]